MLTFPQVRKHGSIHFRWKQSVIITIYEFGLWVLKTHTLYREENPAEDSLW
jgi:hypothetical protein